MPPTGGPWTTDDRTTGLQCGGPRDVPARSGWNNKRRVAADFSVPQGRTDNSPQFQLRVACGQRHQSRRDCRTDPNQFHQLLGPERTSAVPLGPDCATSRRAAGGITHDAWGTLRVRSGYRSAATGGPVAVRTRQRFFLYQPPKGVHALKELTQSRAHHSNGKWRAFFGGRIGVKRDLGECLRHDGMRNETGF